MKTVSYTHLDVYKRQALGRQDTTLSLFTHGKLVSCEMMPGGYKMCIRDRFTTEVTIRKQLEAHIHDHPGTLFVIKDIDQELPELVYEAADYTEVDRALQVVAGLKKTDYEDFSAVDAAVAAVVRGKNFTQQDEVDAMAKAINDAVSKLVKKAPTTEGGSTNTGNQGVASPNTGDETQPMLFAVSYTHLDVYKRQSSNEIWYKEKESNDWKQSLDSCFYL